MGNSVSFSNIVFIVCGSFLKFSPCGLCIVTKYVEERNHGALTKMIFLNDFSLFLMNKELKIKKMYLSAKSHYSS